MKIYNEKELEKLEKKYNRIEDEAWDMSYIWEDLLEDIKKISKPFPTHTELCSIVAQPVLTHQGSALGENEEMVEDIATEIIKELKGGDKG